MTKRGRKSASDVAVIPLVSNLPPEPPYSLQSDEAAEVWREVVSAMPSGWFPPETLELLATYCRHVVTARFLSREVDRYQFDWLKIEGGIERLNKLTAMRERESRAMMSAARALRLTNQSRFRPDAAASARQKPSAGSHRPWD
jgi:hypothetical protein